MSKMKTAALVLGLIITSSAVAGVPIATLDGQSATYDNLDAAAIAFAAKIRQPKNDDNKELAGVIFRTPDDKYQLSLVMNGTRDGDTFAVRFPKGYNLAALVHSHTTTQSGGEYFSPLDVQVAKQLNVPSYIQFDVYGQVRCYVPGKDVLLTIDRFAGIGLPYKVAQGHLVLKE